MMVLAKWSVTGTERTWPDVGQTGASRVALFLVAGQKGLIIVCCICTIDNRDGRKSHSN
jgi:hypothetical protein